MKGLEALLDSWDVMHYPIVEPSAGKPTRHIPGSAIKESVDFFARSGGDLSRLLDVLNRKYSVAHRNGHIAETRLTEQLVSNDSFFYSCEFGFLLSMFSKVLAGDTSHRFRLPDGGLLSAGHKIFERAPVSCRVVVDREHGQRGVSGRNFVSSMRTLDSLLSGYASERGIDSGQFLAAQYQKLFSALNMMVREEGVEISRQLLEDNHLWFSYELSQQFFELCKVISGRSDFIEVMCGQNFPRAIKLFTTVIPIDRTFGMMSFFANKYNDLLEFRTTSSGKSHATVTVEPSKQLLEEAGEYFHACMQNSCDVGKFTMASIPREMYGLKRYHLEEPLCCANPAEAIFGDHCVYEFRWLPIFTGFKRLLNPVFLSAAANVPLDYYVLSSDLSPLEKALSVLLGAAVPLVTYGIQSIMNHRRVVSDIEEYHRSQEARAEEQRHKIIKREIALARSSLEKTYSALYIMSMQYSNYLRLLQSDDVAAAKEQMDVLRRTVAEYLSSTTLKDQGAASLSDLRRKLDAASLFIAFGEVVDGTFDPLTGRSGSAVFLTDANAEGAKIAKRFALKEMGIVEALVYDWFSRRSLYDRQRFPTPDILAYRVVPTRDENGSPLDVPIMMMETIEGPTLYDFFRRLDARVSPGQVRSLADMKDRMIEGWINRYCYIAEESQSNKEGSLGKYLDSKGAVRVAAGDYVSKVREAFDADVLHLPGEDRKSLLYVVAEQLGAAVSQVRKVPFADMSPLNGSMPARGLYSKVVSLCRGIDQSAAEADVSGHAADEVTDRLLEEIVANISDSSKSSELFDVCSQEIVRFDFEKLRMETVEFDDLCHIVDFFPYGPSAERRSRMNALYIALRYIPESFERKPDVISLLGRGKTSEAVALMGEVIDYRGLESQRALVSIYRNLRWMRFYGGLDDSKFDAMHSREATVRYHAELVVQDISCYLNLNQASGIVDVARSNGDLRAGGISAGLRYLKECLDLEGVDHD